METGQEYLLSFLLFSIILDILVTIIHKENEIKTTDGERGRGRAETITLYR